MKINEVILESNVLDTDPKTKHTAIKRYAEYPKGIGLYSAYNRAVNKLIKQGGTVYRSIYAKNKQSVDLTNPGKHWSIYPNVAEAYAREEGYMQADDEDSHAFLISATVAPNNITNADTYFETHAHEFEVQIINPKLAKIEFVKEIDLDAPNQWPSVW